MTLRKAILGTAMASLASGRRFPLCGIDVTVVEPLHRFQLVTFARAWRRWFVAPVVKGELS